MSVEAADVTTPRTARIMAMSILTIASSAQGVMLLGAGIGEIGPELGIGPEQLGLLTALYFGAAAVTSSPAGRVVERIGWQKALRINATAIGVLLLMIARFANSSVVFGALLLAMGAIYGLANPATNQALADHIDPSRRGVIFGLKHAGIPVATLLAGAAVPVIILNSGWRSAFVVAAAIAFSLLLIVPGGEFPATAHRFEEDPRRTVEPLPRSMLGWLALVGLLGTISVAGLSSFLVSSLVHDGFTAATAGWIQFSGAAFSIAGRIGFGWVTDRHGGKGFTAMTALIGIGGVVFLAFVPASGWWYAILVAIAFATAWGWPGLFTYAVVNANSSTAAASSGFAYSGMFAGAAAGPILIGEIIERASFEAAWIFTAVCLLIAAVVVAWVSRQIVPRATASPLAT